MYPISFLTQKSHLILNNINWKKTEICNYFFLSIIKKFSQNLSNKIRILKEFYFGYFSVYRNFRKIDQYLLLNFLLKNHLVKKIEIIFFFICIFSIGFISSLFSNH